ncbi:SDR family oxidoreductase [Imhoffiella purpurea]|uniref:Short-chain dehydrogenase/reductase SDR n=1 Tax=Imhoffiella purpurea TaxID=1249627 RepID=W9V943_9GAMM|nr:SDR family NAD(P)-dependent oxidoreductase [Imhoffiella purpurea]EXJ15954.1 short-chain dehydrogenase/reductase SDR [Imhoffiella purpurea]
MSDLNGKTVILTGATGNLGQVLARRLAERGARLALVGRDPQKLAAARQQLPATSEVATFAADLVDSAAVGALIQAMRQRFDAIHVLINAAGGFAMGPTVKDTSDADWDRIMDLNLRTAFNCSRAVIPALLAAGEGRILNVSARAATRGVGGMAPYCTSKSALITLTESLAEELKPNGITANCVLPGTLDTPENRAAMPDQDQDTWVPLEALADVILFLVSDAARCVTGAAIPVYGRS